MPVAPDDLEDRPGTTTRRGVLAAGHGGQPADAVGAHHRQLGLQAGQPVAQHGVVDAAVGPCPVADECQLALEPDDLAEGRHAALEAEQAHRHAPALPHLADHQVGVGDGAGEEDLVELRPAGQLLDRPDLDAGLVDRDEQEGEPLVALRARLGAGDDEDPLGEVRVGRPHLLTVDDPLRAVVGEPRARLDVGEVGAGVRLGVALRPQLLDVANARQEPIALRVGAEGDERRPEQLLTEVVDRRRGVGPGVLLVEDHLLPQAQPTPTVLGGPPDARPALPGQEAVPLQPLAERLVVAPGATEPAQRLPLAGQVVLEEGAHVGAERLVRC